MVLNCWILWQWLKNPPNSSSTDEHHSDSHFLFWQWRIQKVEPWGAEPYPPPPFGFFFFYKSKIYEQKISIRWVRNLSQNAGNGHFRDTNFQKFLGGACPQTPLENSRFWHSWCAPPPLKVLDLSLFNVSHFYNCRFEWTCLPPTILKETLFNSTELFFCVTSVN